MMAPPLTSTFYKGEIVMPIVSQRPYNLNSMERGIMPQRLSEPLYALKID
tara:strand:- start:263 stop:412 length:150 start_codon:yes stop_codon:yes gene_type:complete